MLCSIPSCSDLLAGHPLVDGRSVVINSQRCFHFSTTDFLKSLRVYAHRALPLLEILIEVHHNYHHWIDFRNYLHFPCLAHPCSLFFVVFTWTSNPRVCCYIGTGYVYMHFHSCFYKPSRSGVMKADMGRK